MKNNILYFVFILLGVFIISGKGDFLLSGYNNLSNDAKKKIHKEYRMKNIRQVIGIILILIGIFNLGKNYGILEIVPNILLYIFLFCIFVYLIFLVLTIKIKNNI